MRARENYLVECYWPGVDARSVAAAVERAHVAAASLAGGRRVELVDSILVPVDETVFCLFEGRARDVKAVIEQAGMPFERVLESLRIDRAQASAPEDRDSAD